MRPGVTYFVSVRARSGVYESTLGYSDGIRYGEQQCTAYPWHIAAVYDQPGTVVAHDGALYRNKWWTRGEEPGAESWGVWEYVEACVGELEPPTCVASLWDNETYYGYDSTVTYDGAEWRAEWPNEATAPGTVGGPWIWEHPCVAE